MDKFPIDYATLTSAYQSKLNELTQQVVFLEAKTIILEKVIGELNEQLDSLSNSTAKKKSVESKEKESNYGL